MSLRLVCLLTIASLLSACSWFADSTPQSKPAELTEFKARAELQRVWQAEAGKAGTYVFSPDTDGEAVYAAGHEGRIVKLDLASGKELWRIDTDKSLSAGVGVGHGLVLVATPKGEVLAYKTKNGEPAWQVKLGGEILASPAAGPDGLMAVRSLDGRLWLLDAATGAKRWNNSHALPTLIDREQSLPIVTGQGVFAGYPGGRLALLALNNGAAVWESTVALPKGATELERMTDVSGPMALDERRICASAYQGRVACFERGTGKLLWAREVSASRGVDMDDKQVYTADTDGSLLAYDKERGSNIWKQDRLRYRQLSSPVAVAERYVAVGDLQGYVHLINVEDGAFAARAATDKSAVRGLMLPLKSGLVVQTDDGSVTAFRIQ
jgi:outer membrane protein assembly factor BamB